jgi:hypothetical protein
VGGGGRVNIVPPQANFKTLVNKNAIKPKIGGPPPPRQFFLKALTPLGMLAKNRIFNPCASMNDPLSYLIMRVVYKINPLS